MLLNCFSVATKRAFSPDIGFHLYSYGSLEFISVLCSHVLTTYGICPFSKNARYLSVFPDAILNREELSMIYKQLLAHGPCIVFSFKYINNVVCLSQMWILNSRLSVIKLKTKNCLISVSLQMYQHWRC